MIHEERSLKFAKRKQASASANQDTAGRDVISASPATTVILTVSRATAAISEVRRAFVLRTESARVCRISLAALVTSAVRVTSNIQNVSVSFLFSLDKSISVLPSFKFRSSKYLNVANA